MIDVLIFPSINALYEAFANLTLMFGFGTGAVTISVIGVGWFLGLVFVFYLCFPFMCFLLETKRKAWISFVISIIYNFICVNYFQIGRTNILYSACFFIAGGLVYLYKDKIEKMHLSLAVVSVIGSIVIYYTIGVNTITYLLVSVALLIYTLIKQGGILENRFMRFFSDISMEVYLSHMMIFRIIERLKLNTRFGSGWIQYFITLIIVLVGTLIFSIVMKEIIEKTENALVKKK